MRFALKPPPGLVSDDTPFAAPGVWEDALNMRPWLGKMQALGPYLQAFGATLSGVCRNLLPWTEIDGATVIAFGTHTSLLVHKDGALHDITPLTLSAGNEHSSSGSPGYGSGLYGMGTYSSPASDYFARTWSLATYGQTLIASPRGGTIYQWMNDVLVPAAAVANAPDQCTAVLVTPERQVLAFGCNEEVSGDFNPLAIRGSDVENITDWSAGTNDNAFQYILEGGGQIVTAKLIGSFVGVWTNSALHLGQFVGDIGQAYRFDRVADNCGLIAPNALHIVNQTAFWLGSDYQFRMWQPGTEPVILKCPIWKDFVDNLYTSQKEKIVAAGISKFNEVWFHYPDSRDGNENSRSVAFNIQDATWFRGGFARSAAADAGVLTHPIMAAPTGEVYYHEHSAGTDPAWFLKTSDLYFDEGGRAMMTRGIRPDFEDQEGDVSLTIEVRTYPQGPSTTKGPYTLANDAQKKDMRVSGHVFSIKFSGTEYVRMGKPVFDLAPMGMRA